MTYQLSALMANTAYLQQLQKKLPMLVSLLLVIACAHALAKITWMLLPDGDIASPPALTSNAQSRRTQDSRQHIRQLTSAHLFGIAEQTTTGKVTRAPETRLNLVLRGVIAADPMKLSHAIIARGKNGKEEVFAIGDKMPGGVIIKEIYADRVVLDRGGRLEILMLIRDEDVGSITPSRAMNAYLPPGSPGEELAGIRQHILKNPASFGEYAIPVIVKQNGRQIGYRLQPQQRGEELLEALGLFAGDVITEINGIKLDNPQNGVGALRSLSTARAFSLKVKRNGNVVPLNIQLQ